MDIFGVAVLVFLVTDPFGNIAIYLAALTMTVNLLVDILYKLVDPRVVLK